MTFLLINASAGKTTRFKLMDGEREVLSVSTKKPMTLEDLKETMKRGIDEQH